MNEIPTSDREMVARARGGDREAFGELVERYQRLVFAVTWSRLRDASLCEDAAQETFLLAWEHLGALRNPERFGPWIAAVARSVALRMAAGRRREERTLADWHRLDGGAAGTPSAASLPGDEPIEETAARSLEALRPADREAVTLFYLQERSIRESARLAGVSESVFKVRLHRARLALRREVESALVRMGERIRRTDLRAGVVAALPAAGKTGSPVSGGLTGLLAGWFPVALYSGIWGAVGWSTSELVNNYRNPDRFRRALGWSSFLRGALVIGLGVYLLLIVAGRAGWSERHIQVGLAVYLTLSLALSVQNPVFWWHPHSRGSLMGLAGLALMMNLALFEVLPWKIAFTIGMLLMNLQLWRHRRDLPARNDYSLYLRAANGTLGTVENAVRAPGATPEQLRDFVRLMASRSLAAGVSGWKLPCTIYLTPLVQSPIRYLLPLPVQWFGASTVKVDEQGNWSTEPARRDLVRLRRYFPEAEPERLKEQVGAVAAAAFEHSRAGRPEAALTLLEPESDAEVYHRPPAELRNSRWIYFAAIAGGVLALLLSLLQPPRILDERWGPPVPVTEKLARRAMEVYALDHQAGRTGRLREAFEQPRLPSADFYNSKTRKRLRRILLGDLLRFPDAADPAERTAMLLRNPKPLYNALRSGLISPEEARNELGLTRETITEADARARRDADWPLLPEEPIRPNSREYILHGYRPSRAEQLETFSRRAWILRAVGAADLLPADSVTSNIIALQVRGTLPYRAFGQPVDLNGLLLVDGIHRCLITTWEALVVLESLGRLDAIDRVSCVRALRQIAQAYRPDGGAGSPGYEEDAVPSADHAERDQALFCLFDSLRMLGVGDGIETLPAEEFATVSAADVTATRTGYSNRGNTVVPPSLASWAYLEELERAGRLRRAER